MPNLLEMRWPVVLISLVVSLGLLFGGYKLVQHQTVQAPMDVALHAIDGVQSYAWKDGEIRHLQLTLRPGARLGQTYAAVAQVMQELEPGENVRIDVLDDRTPGLQVLCDQANLAVQEGIQTGHYTEMAQQVAALGQKAGVQASVTVDDRHLFVTLQQDGHRLLEVVRRPDPQQAILQGVSSSAW